MNKGKEYCYDIASSGPDVTGQEKECLQMENKALTIQNTNLYRVCFVVS
jgi:hypothetical protein